MTDKLRVVRDSLIKEIFIETLERYDISDRVYTVTSPDAISIQSLGKQMVLGIYPDKNHILMPCLDQIIDIAKDYLSENLESHFNPLVKIHNVLNKLT